MAPTYVEITRDEWQLLSKDKQMFAMDVGGLCISALGLVYFYDPEEKLTFLVIGNILRSDGLVELTFDDASGERNHRVWHERGALKKAFNQMCEREYIGECSPPAEVACPETPSQPFSRASTVQVDQLCCKCGCPIDDQVGEFFSNDERRRAAESYKKFNGTQ